MPALRWGFVLVEPTARLGRRLTRMMAIRQWTQMTQVPTIVRTKTPEAAQLRSQLDARRWRVVFGEPVSFGDYGLKASYCIKRLPRRHERALRNDMKGAHCRNAPQGGMLSDWQQSGGPKTAARRVRRNRLQRSLLDTYEIRFWCRRGDSNSGPSV